MTQLLLKLLLLPCVPAKQGIVSISLRVFFVSVSVCVSTQQ